MFVGRLRQVRLVLAHLGGTAEIRVQQIEEIA